MRLVTPASRRCLRAVALPLCLSAAIAVSAAPGPPAAPLPGAPIALRFSASVDLPGGARVVLQREVEAIWRREGMQVEWLTGTGLPLPPEAIRVMVVGRDAGVSRSDHQWPVAELLLDDRDRPIAVSSLAAAERVLQAGIDQPEPETLRQRRLGLVLGRALAHEIGHHLLNTAGHARRGLMRARIDARDLVDLRDGGFYLDAPAARWLRDAHVVRSSGVTRLASFAYAP